MSQLKVNSIVDAAGGSSAVLYGVASPPNSMGFRNRIINGEMRIDQRNAGAPLTVNSSSAFYPVDRFYCQGQSADGVFTAQQVTDAPSGFSNSLKLTVTTADASIGASQYYFLQHRVEGYNVADLGFGAAGASSVTVSFWAKSSVPGTFGGSLSNDGFTRSYPFTYTINAANTWEQKTITITGDTSGTWLKTNGTGLCVFWNVGAGSSYTASAGAWAGQWAFNATGANNLISTVNATFQITGVQLEAGTVASPFERRDYGRELMMCQRYYWQSWGLGRFVAEGNPFTGIPIPASLTNGVGVAKFAVSMRSAPTIVLFDDAGASGKASQPGLVNGISVASGGINSTGFTQVNAGSNYTTGSPIRAHYTASAEL